MPMQDTAMPRALGREPDLILGDFDSAPAPDSPAEQLTFPVEKNDTDTMLAMKELYRRGYGKLTIYGGTHGRLDHTFANFQSLSLGSPSWDGGGIGG